MPARELNVHTWTGKDGARFITLGDNNSQKLKFRGHHDLMNENEKSSQVSFIFDMQVLTRNLA